MTEITCPQCGKFSHTIEQSGDLCTWCEAGIVRGFATESATKTATRTAKVQQPINPQKYRIAHNDKLINEVRIAARIKKEDREFLLSIDDNMSRALRMIIMKERTNDRL